MTQPNFQRTNPQDQATQAESTQHHATQVEKRVVTMPDGRYMIFYTYPQIDRDIESRRASTSTPEPKRTNV